MVRDTISLVLVRRTRGLRVSYVPLPVYLADIVVNPSIHDLGVSFRRTSVSSFSPPTNQILPQGPPQPFQGTGNVTRIFIKNCTLERNPLILTHTWSDLKEYSFRMKVTIFL